MSDPSLTGEEKGGVDNKLMFEALLGEMSEKQLLKLSMVYMNGW